MGINVYHTPPEWVYRKSGRWLVKHIFLKTPFTGNFLTFLSFLFAIAAAILFAFGTYVFAIIALVLFEISIFLDYSDGVLARAKNQSTIYGDWLDRTSDFVKDSFIFLAIGFGLYLQTQNYLMLTLGFGCTIVYLARELIAHISGYCYKGVKTNLREEHEKIKPYLIIRNLQSLFSVFLIVAVFARILDIYLWSYLIFYILYDSGRILYSIKKYRVYMKNKIRLKAKL